MLKHIVCWRIKETSQSKEENIAKVKSLLESLPAKIEEIKELEVGVNFNTSDAAFDVCLYSVFEDEKGLSAYQVHPEHVKVAGFIKEVTSERMVADYLV